MNTEYTMKGFGLFVLAGRALKAATALVLVTALAACGGGSGGAVDGRESGHDLQLLHGERLHRPRRGHVDRR